MKPEKQREAIARLCGWEHITKQPFTDHLHCHWEELFGLKPGTNEVARIPDYLNDRSAIVDSIKPLLNNVAVQRKWEVALYHIIRRDEKLPYLYLIEMYRCACATAAQYTEATLRVFGLWEDEQ